MSSEEPTAPGPPFGVVVRQAAGRVVVELEGELDLATAPRLRDRLASLSEDGQDHITVDLTRLQFIDSTGLSVLVMAFNRAHAAGGDVRIESPSPAVLRVFEVTGLTKLFTIVADGDPVPSSGG